LHLEEWCSEHVIMKKTSSLITSVTWLGHETKDIASRMTLGGPHDHSCVQNKKKNPCSSWYVSNNTNGLASSTVTVPGTYTCLSLVLFIKDRLFTIQTTFFFFAMLFRGDGGQIFPPYLMAPQKKTFSPPPPLQCVIESRTIACCRLI